VPWLLSYERGSTNSSSNHAPLATTITSEPSSTKGLAPSARIISNTERAAPENSTVLGEQQGEDSARHHLPLRYTSLRMSSKMIAPIVAPMMAGTMPEPR
jgi:hypothetical protein